MLRLELFVLSSYSENFGNTVLEAMRRRVPVVVTPEVGAAEIVRQSGGGIVAQGDAEDFWRRDCLSFEQSEHRQIHGRSWTAARNDTLHLVWHKCPHGRVIREPQVGR